MYHFFLLKRTDRILFLNAASVVVLESDLATDSAVLSFLGLEAFSCVFLGLSLTGDFFCFFSSFSCLRFLFSSYYMLLLLTFSLLGFLFVLSSLCYVVFLGFFSWYTSSSSSSSCSSYTYKGLFLSLLLGGSSSATTSSASSVIFFCSFSYFLVEEMRVSSSESGMIWKRTRLEDGRRRPSSSVRGVTAPERLAVRFKIPLIGVMVPESGGVTEFYFSST